MRGSTCRNKGCGASNGASSNEVKQVPSCATTLFEALVRSVYILLTSCSQCMEVKGDNFACMHACMCEMGHHVQHIGTCAIYRPRACVMDEAALYLSGYYIGVTCKCYLVLHANVAWCYL